jgi:hypothetical protein
VVVVGATCEVAISTKHLTRGATTTGVIGSTDDASPAAGRSMWRHRRRADRHFGVDLGWGWGLETCDAYCGRGRWLRPEEGGRDE